MSDNETVSTNEVDCRTKCPAWYDYYLQKIIYHVECIEDCCLKNKIDFELCSNMTQMDVYR
uniref:Uncharacterized protein n=1 Tax=Romanomermis culicivorax TaxID=13658 RepID=A0A915KY96_ROMCU